MIGVKWRRCAGGASELTYHAAECRVQSVIQLNSVFAPAALVGALPALGDQVLDFYPAGRPRTDLARSRLAQKASRRCLRTDRAEKRRVNCSSSSIPFAVPYRTKSASPLT